MSNLSKVSYSDNISFINVVLMSLLSTLNRFHALFWCFHCCFELVNSSLEETKNCITIRCLKNCIKKILKIVLKKWSVSMQNYPLKMSLNIWCTDLYQWRLIYTYGRWKLTTILKKNQSKFLSISIIVVSIKTIARALSMS